MPSQHKHQPVAYRPPADVRDWLRALAARTGRAVNGIITDALREYRAAHDSDQESGEDQ